MDPAETLGDAASWFDERLDRPLEPEVRATEERNGVQVHDVSYAGHDGRRWRAYWLAPPGRDRFPAVCYVHPSPGDRSTFFNEGIRLGGMGIGSLLVEAPWADAAAFALSLGGPEQNRDLFIGIIRDLRRAVTFAESQEGTDHTHLGYVGHSFGALCGGVLGGIERRLRALVLMAGAPSFTDVALANAPSLSGAALERYREVMAPIDPVRYIGATTPASLFLQFGERDAFFPHERTEALSAAASEPKVVRWYDTDHYFESEEARRDRVEWLHGQLGSGYRRMKGSTGRTKVYRR